MKPHFIEVAKRVPRHDMMLLPGNLPGRIRPRGTVKRTSCQIEKQINYFTTKRYRHTTTQTQMDPGGLEPPTSRPPLWERFQALYHFELTNPWYGTTVRIISTKTIDNSSNFDVLKLIWPERYRIIDTWQYPVSHFSNSSFSHLRDPKTLTAKLLYIKQIRSSLAMGIVNIIQHHTANANKAAHSCYL